MRVLQITCSIGGSRLSPVALGRRVRRSIAAWCPAGPPIRELHLCYYSIRWQDAAVGFKQLRPQFAGAGLLLG